MGRARNILFIMCDQLRWDYLSCYGQGILSTPNIDRLAAMGVRFERAYAQSPVCGPSRMSFYTGRTVFSHGATWNFVPLPIGERTIGDYLKPHGIRVGVAGKTHMAGDTEGLGYLGINKTSIVSLSVSEGGFEPFERDDGEPKAPGSPRNYNDWLRSKGYESADPWNDYANSCIRPDGQIVTGWSMRNARFPSRVKEEHSETAFITNRGLEFIEECGEAPWLLHLSYIKPHWPYVAPAPYHQMYGPGDIPPAQRADSERVDPHPVYSAFMDMDAARAFSREDVRESVIPTYMGLIRQIDDHIGRILSFLEANGRLNDTMIIFTSDHGDYLGDHWLGEKELFHEPSVRIPLIIVDPNEGAEATRGMACSHLVEAIDLVPTFMESLGLEAPMHRLEGRSLVPFLRGTPPTLWRSEVFSELDYSFYRARLTLGVEPAEARCYMVRTEHWKYVFFKSFRPQLFDLVADPGEFQDLGDSDRHRSVLCDMRERLLDRLISRRNRVTISDEVVAARTDKSKNMGVIIGQW